MSGSDWGLLLLLSLLWGGSFFFNQVALRDLPTLTVVAARVALAALVLWGALVVRGLPVPRGREVWAGFLVMGVLNNVVPFVLIVWGQGQIGSAVASILNASTPLLTVLLAHRLTSDERLTPARLAGVAVGLTGVAVMTGGAVFGGSAPLAYAACLGAALSYAFAGLWGRRFRALGVPPLATAAGQLSVSAAVLLPLAALADRPWTLESPGAAAVASLASVAVLSTALAYILYFRLLERAGATNLSTVTFLIPVTAILLGVTVLGEALLPRHVAGMALIALGLATLDGRAAERLRRIYQ